jgi:hypothetical protein
MTENMNEMNSQWKVIKEFFLPAYEHQHFPLQEPVSFEMVLGLSGSAGSLAGEKKSGVFLMTSWPDLFQVARNQEPLFFSLNS